MDNLFVNIEKYRPREGNNPKENFFTELLSFILRNDPILLVGFAKKFGLGNLTSKKPITLLTQSSHEGKFIDIEITQGNTCIFIENKIDATVNEWEEQTDMGVVSFNQLQNYLEIQQRLGFENRSLAILSVYPQDLKEDLRDKVAQIYWKDVYLFLKEAEPADPALSFIVKQFCGLMEAENMNPYEAISQNDLNGFNHCMDNLQKLFDEVLAQLKLNRWAQIYETDRIGNSFKVGALSFEIDYYRRDQMFKLWVGSNNNKFTPDQSKRLKDAGYQGTKGFWMSYDLHCDPKFLAQTKDEQVKTLVEFCDEHIKRTTEILGK